MTSGTFYCLTIGHEGFCKKLMPGVYNKTELQVSSCNVHRLTVLQFPGSQLMLVQISARPFHFNAGSKSKTYANALTTSLGL